MARHLSGARALALGIAAATLAPLALAAPATAQPSSAHRIDPDSLRGRSGRVVTDSAAVARTAKTVQRQLSSAQDRSVTPRDGAARRTAAPSPSGVRLTTSAPSATTSGAAVEPQATPAAASSCALTPEDVNTLTDRSIVHLSYPGATSVALLRKRDGGSWRTVTTISGASGTVTDRGVNQRVGYQYRLVARSTTASGTTVLADCIADGWFGTWTEDGWGDPDAVVGGSGGLFQQGQWSQGDRVASSATVSPAYSTDGRLVAATRVIDSAAGRAVLEVRRASTAGLVFTVDLGASVFPADAAFSPDGQTIAFTRYDAASGDAQGLSFVDVFGSHAVRRLDTATRIGEPVWRADGTTLVVSTFGVATPGLGLVSATGTTVSPISGTAGGFTPEMAPDGTIWFGWSDGTTHALRHRLANGSVTDFRSSTTEVFYQPRFVPHGTLYLERDTPSATTPGTFDVTIDMAFPYGYEPGDEDGSTNIGWERVGTSIAGWDVRQPQSKGTSDFYAEAHHDVVGRDPNGNLWAYRNVGTTLTERVKIGAGWGGFTAILAGGDLNGDDQADLVGRDAKGALWLYRGKAAGGFAARTALGTGWNGYTLVAPGDLNGDDKADLVARDGSGRLWLYPGTGRGTLGARVALGTGWGGMTALLGTGDVDFDNRADLVARDAKGVLWLYPGNGTGGFLARRQLGSGWGAFTGLAVTEVTNGRPMFFARTKDGTLISYEMTGDGRFSSGDVYRVAPGWGGLTFTA